MKFFTTKAEVQTWIKDIQTQGGTICLVPTMGFFHAGHLALMQRAGEIADFVLVTLFVNPTQFAPGEDLADYPRDLDADLQKAQSIGVQALFCPDVKEMYPESGKTIVSVQGLSHQLCGGSRPTHFNGVATVVTKLFNICRVDFALFGEKDFQQLAVIRQIVKDLNIQIQIHSLAIVREADGLAMSSRNVFLSADERRQAVCLSQGVKLAQDIAHQGGDCVTIIDKVTALILQNAAAVIDYIAIVNQFTLDPSRQVDKNAILVMAVKMGKPRLLDNGFLLSSFCSKALTR